jgi:putative DNA methylase
MKFPVKSPKKLIEVALPLDAINVAAAREKSIRHGHPSTLHLWWARRPLAAARAVIFAQMVNDPGYQQGSGFRYGVNKEKAALERERLFRIVEDLVLWENSNNEELLERARAEIRRSWRETCELNKNHPQAAELFNPEKLPGFHDPFAGGGAIPLEAQRLGLDSYASDLNPVAVTINKAMIEIPPRFAGRKPVGPLPQGQAQTRLHEDWSGPRGLAEDVRRYAMWMRDRAAERIGHLYPAASVTAGMGKQRPDLKAYEGQTLKVIAWLWARTIRSPNPAYGHVEVPLVSSFLLGTKEGREVYLEPTVQGEQYRFEVRFGQPPAAAKNGTKAVGKGSNFFCLLSGSPIEGKYIKAEAQAGRLGSRMIAVVAEGKRGRVYLNPTPEHETAARPDAPIWSPTQELVGKARDQMPLYGMPTFGHLFTARQLTALNTFSDLLIEVQKDALKRATDDGYGDDLTPLEQGGRGAKAYAEAVSVYLAFAVDRSADYWSAVSSWHSGPKMEAIRNTFGRQAISMTWDFAEANPFSESSGNWLNNTDWCIKAIEGLPGTACTPGTALADNASTQAISANKVVSTDPPYYDNIAYADLSDFFYVWLRRNLRGIFPALFATMAVPKSDELVATLYRHDSREAAEAFFLSGMTQAMNNLAKLSHPAYPVSIYYAFKQSETKGDAGTSSTGWDTFLQAVLNAGFSLTGTWPMRTEMGNRMVSSGTNALASSIVLVCRPRASDAATVSRREFIRELNAALPLALDEMTRGGVNSPVAPVDLSQAIIGPGMAIFSQYAAVLEADGTPMPVKTALQLINRFLAEDDFDHDTQFCLHWFEQQGWATGKYGEADVLARAKGTSVNGLTASGVVDSSKGELRLRRWEEMPREWTPETDARLPVWEALHQLIRALNQDGESAAGALLSRMPAQAEPIRALAYRLYTLCERKGWADDARAYNELVTAWSGIEQAAGESGVIGSQAQLDI